MAEQTMPSTTQPFGRMRMVSMPALIDLLSLLVISLPAILVALTNLHYAYDDAFITYRYAYNLASGQGFVYNPGEWFLGTTAPLYGLILGVLGWMSRPEAIPSISGGISGMALLAGGVALYLYGRLHHQRLCGVLAGLFFVTHPMLPVTFGGEMLFQVALILWAFVCYRMERTRLAAVLLALAILTRADGMLAAGIIGGHFVITRRHLPWREGLIMVGILLPFCLLAWIFYGSPVPSTLDAKLAQHDSGLWPTFWAGLAEWMQLFRMQGSKLLYPLLPALPGSLNPALFIALGLAIIGLFRFWLLPLAWVGSYLYAYHLLNVPFYHWYALPAVAGLAILAACGIAALVTGLTRVYSRFRQTPGTPLLTAVLGAICILWLIPGIATQLENRRRGVAAGLAEAPYMEAGLWFAAHTPPDAQVGFFEIGYVGYFSQRTMIDPLGLATPQAIEHIASHDLTWAYAYYRPDYILHNPAKFGSYIGKVTEQPWFQQEYVAVAQIAQHDLAPLVIYQRVGVPEQDAE